MNQRDLRKNRQFCTKAPLCFLQVSQKKSPLKSNNASFCTVNCHAI